MAQMEGFYNLSRPEYRHRPPEMENVLIHLHSLVNMEERYLYSEPLHFTDGGNGGPKWGRIREIILISLRSGSQRELAVAGEDWGWDGVASPRQGFWGRDGGDL